MASLEQLEGDVWPAPTPDETTSLVVKCHRLRKQDISTLTPEDVRVLLGQGIGLSHLTPFALAILERQPLEAGTIGFPGALLTALLRPANWSAIEGWSPRIEAVCQIAVDSLAGGAPTAEINAYLKRRSHKH